MSAQPSVDWETAGVWAGQLTPAGPTPSRTEATDLVEGLRQAAHRVRDLAIEASGLADALATPGAIREPAQVLVVDRAGWARAAAASFTAVVTDPLPGTTGQRVGHDRRERRSRGSCPAGPVHDQHLRRFPDRTGGGERVGQARGLDGQVTDPVRGLAQTLHQVRRLGARRRRAGGGQLPGPHTSGLPVDGRLRAHPPTLTGGSGGELTDEGVDRRARLLLTAAGTSG